VDVGITVSAEGVLLQVSDDGQGTPGEVTWEALERQGHMGLAGMRERITALGGTVRFRGHAGAGARLEVLVPSLAANRP
jgi:signal transduction histidine kinase